MNAWESAGRTLTAKMISELAYEGLLTPTLDGDGGYKVAGHGFRASRTAFGGWRVDPRSVPGDPVEFLIDIRDELGLDGATAAEAVRDLTATWAADARLRAELPDAAVLADLGHVELEAWQDGHPCVVLNKGRLGFTGSAVDLYAPESRAAFRLPWLAVHPDLATRHGADVLAEELDEETRARFGRASPAGYVWLPVHPFHLDAAVRPLFAPYLGDGRMVELGHAPDRYRPLASVRTLANVDHPRKHNVKLPLLMRNTLVWRGLPAGPTAAAPAVTAWLRDLPGLRGRLDLLGEVASVAARHPAYERLDDAPYRYHELLGAVWREPVDACLRPGERARTMAALLRVGGDGRALAAELVARSGLGAEAWLGRFLRALLPGLLHALHAEGVAFCPHGENTVVVYRDETPVRVMIKDFAEDVSLLPGIRPDAPDVLLRWPERELAHSIQSAILAGHLRFLAPIFAEHLGVPEERFWELVRDVVAGHVPDGDPFGLLAPEFGRVCLNREHLTGANFHDRAEKDESFDVIDGTVPNPLAL